MRTTKSIGKKLGRLHAFTFFRGCCKTRKNYIILCSISSDNFPVVQVSTTGTLNFLRLNTIAMFLIIDMQTIPVFHTEFIDMFIMYLHTEFKHT
jgi:hypothetical protein